MKIGIISQLNTTNVNFGNKLQAYALNRYLREQFPEHEIVSLYFSDYGCNYITKKQTMIRKLTKKIKRIPLKLMRYDVRTSLVNERLKRINQFVYENIAILDQPWSWAELNENDFDIVIVGSDIVWGQFEGRVNRKFFLDFCGKKDFRRISYAASFGVDWIPNENRDVLVQYLSRFHAISVRESSSLGLLSEIGIENAKYVLDPTLLISKTEWRKIEKKPQEITEPYLFTYFLGHGKKIRRATTRFAKSGNLMIVTIPYASGVYNKADAVFGDRRLMNCSVEEWLWLIDNAEIVVTDSFHGVVLSTIFEKKFIVLQRTYSENINNRMLDFLKNIDQLDKMIQDLNELDYSRISNLEWDYDRIKSRVKPLIEQSKGYIEKALIYN